MCKILLLIIMGVAIIGYSMILKQQFEQNMALDYEINQAHIKGFIYGQNNVKERQEEHCICSNTGQTYTGSASH